MLRRAGTRSTASLQSHGACCGETGWPFAQTLVSLMPIRIASVPVGGGLKLLLPGAEGIGDAAGDGDPDGASSESSSSESLRMSSSLNERSLTPSSRGVSPVSSRGVCLHGGEPVSLVDNG